MIATTIENLKEEILGFRTLGLMRSASLIIEKLFWLLIAISGTIWFFFFVGFQVNLWNTNSTTATKGQLKLSDIDYPAVTFCSKVANKYGIVERFGNHLDPHAKQKNEELAWLQKQAMNCSFSKHVENVKKWNGVKGQTNGLYNKYCLTRSIGESSPPCEVRFQNILLRRRLKCLAYQC